jgi:hypothetical protein
MHQTSSLLFTIGRLEFVYKFEVVFENNDSKIVMNNYPKLTKLNTINIVDTDDSRNSRSEKCFAR